MLLIFNAYCWFYLVYEIVVQTAKFSLLCQLAFKGVLAFKNSCLPNTSNMIKCVVVLSAKWRVKETQFRWIANCSWEDEEEKQERKIDISTICWYIQQRSYFALLYFTHYTAYTRINNVAVFTSRRSYASAFLDWCCRYFDTTWRGNHSSFPIPTEVGGRCPLPPEILT